MFFVIWKFLVIQENVLRNNLHSLFSFQFFLNKNQENSKSMIKTHHTPSWCLQVKQVSKIASGVVDWIHINTVFMNGRKCGLKLNKLSKKNTKMFFSWSRLFVLGNSQQEIQIASLSEVAVGFKVQYARDHHHQRP